MAGIEHTVNADVMFVDAKVAGFSIDSHMSTCISISPSWMIARVSSDQRRWRLKNKNIAATST